MYYSHYNNIIIIVILAVLTQYACHYYDLSTTFRVISFISSMGSIIAASAGTSTRREKDGMLGDFHSHMSSIPGSLLYSLRVDWSTQPFTWK